MQEYIEEVFGAKPEIEEWDGRKKLPLYLRTGREYYVLSIGETRTLLIKISNEKFNMSIFQKQKQQVAECANLPVVLWFESISSYQRQALIKNKIAFIVPHSQLYVPELGMCLKEHFEKPKEKPAKMSAITQYLLLYLIYRKESRGESQTELAVKLNISAMKVSRAVQELKQLNLVTVRQEGKNKMVESVAHRRDLYERSKAYFCSPVQKVIYVCCKDVSLEFLIAGEEALARKSMLNLPKHRVFALDKKKLSLIPEEKIINPKWTLEDNYIEVELWKYDPLMYARDGLVDVISLAHSFENGNDERIETQIEKMMEDYKW